MHYETLVSSQQVTITGMISFITNISAVSMQAQHKTMILSQLADQNNFDARFVGKKRRLKLNNKLKQNNTMYNVYILQMLYGIFKEML